MSTTKYFSVIGYAKQLRNAGATIEQADIQASALWNLRMSTEKSRESDEDNSTKIDIVDLKLEFIKWLLTTVLGTGFTMLIAIAGMLKYMR